MNCEDMQKMMHLCFENEQYVLTPITDKSVAERASDRSSVSSHSSGSHRCQEVPVSGNQKSGTSKNKRTVPSTSSASAKGKGVAGVKKKKMCQFLCTPCEVRLNTGDICNHVLGKQHKKKAVPQISWQYSVTVKGFSPGTTEKIMYDYFSTFGVVKTIFIYREQDLCAVIEFIRKCSVLHATEYCAHHRLGNSNLTVTEGLPFEKVQNDLLDGHAYSQKISSVKEARMKRERCNICNVELKAGNCREHYLSKQHTKKAYFRFKEYNCITVKGLCHNTRVPDLYDYLSRAGRVITLVIFREKMCAVAEYLKRCSVDHVVNCLVPHKLVNCHLVVSSGMPFGGCLPDVPVFLNENSGSVTNLSGKGPQNTRFICDACSAVINPGDRRSHYLSKNHIKKTVPLMKENFCITVGGCPPTVTKEELYDYFSFYESVRTIDMTRHMQGFVIIEFEKQYPLRDVVDSVNTLMLGRTRVTVIRGYPSPGAAAQGAVSLNDTKCYQQKQKTVDSHAKSHTVKPASRTLDSLIKNDFKNAMKSLKLTANPDMCNMNTEGHPLKDENISKSSAPNSEIEERNSMPVMCDACNLFIKPESLREHMNGKKHNENAMKYLSENCCITVKGFPKSSRIEDFYSCFGQFGEVKVVVIPKRKEMGALVGFDRKISASLAAKANGNLVLKNSQLTVRFGYPLIHARGKPMESLPVHDNLMSSLQKCKTVKCQISCMQSSLLLSRENMDARKNLWKSILEILSPFFPSSCLHLFGSSENSFGLKGSDVDMLFEAYPLEPDTVMQSEYDCRPEIKSPSVREVTEGRFDVQKLSLLPKLSQLDFIKKVFRKATREFHTVIFVSAAACPIIKFISKKYGLSCDLSNGNRLSLYNTALLKTFGKLDERVIPLVTVLRYWAKKFNYISSHSFSSYAFTLMVVFFLQRRVPPILPSVKDLRSLTDEKIEVAGFDCNFCSDPQKVERSTNRETLESLLFEFFDYFGKFDYDQYVISPLTGQCELVVSFKCTDTSSSQNFKVSPVCIQDPFQICRNCSSLVKKDSLERITEQMRKITQERCNYLQKQKSQTVSQNAIWGIPQLFEIMPRNLKLPKKIRSKNSFSEVKIALDEKIVTGVKKKYAVNCTQCINLSETVINEVCRIIIDAMHVLLFDTEITVDEKGHCEWALNAKNLSFLCTCAESQSTAVLDEQLYDDLIEMSSGSSMDSSALGEELREDYLGVNGRTWLTEDTSQDSDATSRDSDSQDSDATSRDSDSQDSDVTSQDSDAGQCSDDKSSEKTVGIDMLGTQGPDSAKVHEKYDVSKHKFLSLQFTVTYRTWACRKKYRKRCNLEVGVFEIEKYISQRLTEIKSLQLKTPVKFKCEFYYHCDDGQPVLYLNVVPPDQERCWKAVTSFLQSYLPKMVQCALSS